MTKPESETQLLPWDREPDPCWSCGGNAEARDDIHVRCIDSKGVDCEVMNHWYTRKTWNTRVPSSEVKPSPSEVINLLQQVVTAIKTADARALEGLLPAIENAVTIGSIVYPSEVKVDAEAASLAQVRAEVEKLLNSDFVCSRCGSQDKNSGRGRVEPISPTSTVDKDRWAELDDCPRYPMACDCPPPCEICGLNEHVQAHTSEHPYAYPEPPTITESKTVTPPND